MKTNTTIEILINLGTYANNYVPGEHSYHNLIPGTKAVAFSTAILGEPEFEVYYPRVTQKQIKEAIQTGFNIIDAYGDLIKQILAFIGFANYLKLIDDQETKTYLDKLYQINENYYFRGPETNYLDLEIALDTVQITPNLNSLSYTISFNY